ncbi:hypothetical protein [Nostoc sp.]
MSIQAPLSTKRLCMGHFAIFAEIFVGSYFGKGIAMKVRISNPIVNYDKSSLQRQMKIGFSNAQYFGFAQYKCPMPHAPFQFSI